jgi:dihydroxy-acid dehydratase
MASILEVMGLTLPNSSSNPSISIEKLYECKTSGKTIKNLIENDIKPLDIVTHKSFQNAISMLFVTGGSTNGIIHLLAMAKAANIHLTLDNFRDLQHLPVLLNMKPHGEFMMYHLHQKGGMSLFIKYLIEIGIIDGSVMTITGKTLNENLKNESTYELSNLPEVICPIYNPFKSTSHIKIIDGNMAPNGAVLKSCETPKKMEYIAKVYDSENDMIIDLENGNIKRDNIVIIRYQGESVGCPEMLTPTSALIGYFGNNPPPLATDGRFSGGSHGILICHLPDAHKDNSITSIIENDDSITLDTLKNIINLNLCYSDIESRYKLLIKNDRIPIPNYVNKYSKLVGNINEGYST